MEFKVNVFVPKDILRQSIVQDSIAQVMVKKTAPEVYSLFKGTVSGWDNKPTFKRKLKRSMNYMSMSVWADGEGLNSRGIAVWKQYAMVNQGVDRHDIPKSGTTYMRFPDGRGYKSSTRPRMLTSGPRANFGQMVVKFKVDHPGLKAREFDKTIAEKYEPIFRKDIQDAIGVAAAKTAQSNS